MRLYYFGEFGTVWLPYETWCKTGRTNAKVRATMSHQNFSQRTNPIHPFGPQSDILVSFVLFGCIRDRLVASRNSVQKWDDLVHKFVPRSRVGIFRNERTRSTALDPKLPFWCVSYYLGAFRTLWFPHETQYKTGQTSAKVRATKLGRNFSHGTHPIHPIGP